MTLKNRLTKIERHAGDVAVHRPQVIEIFGTRDDGTRYKIETWKQFFDAANVNRIESESWQRIIEPRTETPEANNTKGANET